MCIVPMLIMTQNIAVMWRLFSEVELLTAIEGSHDIAGGITCSKLEDSLFFWRDS